LARAGLIALVLAAACAVAAPAARADGDPASDVLLFQRVFLSYFKPDPATDTAELKRVVGEANRRGYPIRVALIGGKGDLGSVPSFWRKPQQYVEFLGQELSVLPVAKPYKSRVLVVMPNGYGLGLNGKALTAERGALKGVATPEAAGENLSAGAIRAVQALAAAKGIHIAARIPKGSAGGDGGGGGSHTTLELAGVAVMLLAVGAALEIARRLRRRTAA
jgi:hypothetical protein